MLSACALLHAATGDDAIKQKGNVLVAELAKCQEKLNQDGYLSAYPTSFYDRLKEGQRVWAPFYTYHKILAGHMDMYTLCENEQALATAGKMAGWVDKYLNPISDEQWAKMQMVEHGGMNESLFNLYALTGKEQYLKLARRFDHKKFFDPLAEHMDELKGLHANTNIPKVIGAARGYELTGDRRYHDIADYFWHQVVSERTYSTGGTSNGEHWQTDPGKFADQLGPDAEECCCGYNMLKLTRHLFGWTGEPATMDYRQADKLSMCNIAQIVNLLQSLLLTDGPEGKNCVRTATYHAFVLFQGHRGKTAVKVETDAASADKDKPSLELSLSAPAKSGTVLLRGSGDAMRAGRRDRERSDRTSSSRRWNASNSFDAPDHLVPKPRPVSVEGSTIRLDLPRMSVATVTLTP